MSSGRSQGAREPDRVPVPVPGRSLAGRLGLGRLSIRWRIAIGTVLIAAVLSVGAVVAFRAQVTRILDTTTSTLLQHDAEPFINDVQNNPQSIEKPGRGQLVAVVDPKGDVVSSTLPATLERRLNSLTRLDGDAHLVASGDDVYRVLNETVATGAGDWSIVVARNQDSADLTLDRITQALIFSALVIVLALGLASWLLTAAALRPVTRMRRQAEALAAQGSTEPLPVGPAMDELAGLAATLNEFIAVQRQSIDRERQLVSDASHELRTPIAVLKAQLELAHLSAGDATALEAEIVAAERSVDRLAGLATGLLELFQLEQPVTGRETSSSWESLSAELVEAVDRARIMAAPRRVTIDFDVDEVPTDDLYRLPRGNFERLVGNLAGNSIVAVPEEGRVRIALRHSAVGLVLSVVDSGPGMPEEFIPVAFDRFSRPDESRAAHRGGAGLGLAIVHAIVTAADGTITLANANGLSVTVEIPAIPRT